MCRCERSLVFGSPRGRATQLSVFQSGRRVGPSQPWVQWVLLLISGGKANGEWRWPPTRFAPRLRMSRAIPHFPPCSCVSCYGETFTFIWVKSLKTYGSKMWARHLLSTTCDSYRYQLRSLKLTLAVFFVPGESRVSLVTSSRCI